MLEYRGRAIPRVGIPRVRVALVAVLFVGVALAPLLLPTPDPIRPSPVPQRSGSIAAPTSHETAPDRAGPSSPLAAQIVASPVNGTAPLAVSFYANVSGGFPPYSVAWAFGDASNSAGRWTNHTYNSAGNYTAVAQVHDVANQSTAANVTIAVAAKGVPLSAVAEATPANGRAPLSTTLWVNVTGGRAPYSVRWSFGDGGNGTGTPISHVYRSGGNFTAVAAVRDSVSNQVTTNVLIRVSSPSVGGTPPQLTLVPSPAQGNAPLATNVSATVTGGKAPFNLTVCFDTGGGCSTGPAGWSGISAVVLPHTFLVPGSYTITGTVRDANRNSTTSSAAIRVTSTPPLLVTIAVNRSQGTIPLSVGFLATAQGGTPPYTLQWTFGDGTVGTALTGVEVDHVYRTSGSFSAQLVVSDVAGHRVSQSAPAVSAVAPNPAVHPGHYSTPIVWEILGLAAATTAVAALLATRAVRRWRADRLRRQGEEIVQSLQQGGDPGQR